MTTSQRPRFVPRFALITLVAFVAIGATLSFVVSDQIRKREETTAAAYATFLTDTSLRFQLKDAGFPEQAKPLVGQQYRGLLNAVESRILSDPDPADQVFKIKRIKVWRKDGTVLFSDAPAVVGKKFEVDDDLADAFSGKTSSSVTDLTAEENEYERGLAPKLFETYVPVWLTGAPGKSKPNLVVEIYQDYSGIQHQVDSLRQTIVLTLLVALAILYALMLPISLRITDTMRRQNQALAWQAQQLSEQIDGQRQAVAELKKANRTKTDFIAVASHELRTPLTAVLGYLKTLRNPELATDENIRREFLASAERQAERLARLVENLLAGSRLEEGNLDLSIEPIEFHELAAEVIEGLGERREQVENGVAPDLPQLWSDRQLLEHILQNLLDNSLKYSPPGAACRLDASSDGTELVFSVTDHGIGIPQDQLYKIFDRFYQVDSSSTRAFSGLGLGLSLVKDLVVLLAGDITVRSVSGEGSTFTVTLPLRHPLMKKARVPAAQTVPYEPSGQPGAYVGSSYGGYGGYGAGVAGGYGGGRYSDAAARYDTKGRGRGSNRPLTEPRDGKRRGDGPNDWD